MIRCSHVSGFLRNIHLYGLRNPKSLWISSLPLYLFIHPLTCYPLFLLWISDQSLGSLCV